MVHLYHLFTAPQLSQLQRRAEDLLALWNEAWLPPAHRAEIIGIRNADETAVEGNKQLLHLGACVRYGAESAQRLYALLAQDHYNKATHQPAAAIINGLIDRLLHSLIATLIVRSNSSVDTAPPTSKGSGTVALGIGGGDWSVQVFLPLAAALELGGERPAVSPARLASRKTGVGKGSLKVVVSAGEVELKLADLTELAPGQVVRLNLKTDQAFVLSNAETGAKICDAYLGQSDGKKAVQLIR